MNIIKTDIIDSATDIFWNPIDSDNIEAGKVLVITYNFQPGSPEEQQLKKIMDACKLPADNYNLLQLAENQKLAWHQIKSLYKPGIVLVFGVHPQQLGISALFRLNAPNRFDGATWVPSLSLAELEVQPQAKKDLWGNALKPLFADNQ